MTGPGGGGFFPPAAGAGGSACPAGQAARAAAGIASCDTYHDPWFASRRIAMALTSSGYVPGPDGDFDSWQANWVTYAAANAAALGLAAADVTAIQNAQTAWRPDYDG